MSIDRRYWIEPRDDPKFLTEVLRYFRGGSLILLEGDLARFHFHDIQGNTTIIPELFIPQAPEAKDKIVLPLENSTCEEILNRIMPSNRFKKIINAIEIVKDGDIRFMAADEFHHECITMHSDTPTEFLEALRAKLIIKRFRLKERGAP